MATRTVSDAGGNWADLAAWVEGAVPTNADDVVWTATSGNVAINSPATCKSLDQTGDTGAAGILTNNAGRTLTVVGSCKFLAGKYVANSVTAAIAMTATGTLTTGGALMGNLTFNKSGGVLTLGDSFTGRSAATSDVLVAVTITAGSIDLNGQTLSGGSSTARLLVRSATLGTPMTITTTTAGSAFANCDFQDIAFANGGADLDLSAITGLSGDCGGNAMSGGGTLTFTSALKLYWITKTAGTHTWSTAANWNTQQDGGGTSRVPLPQDSVSFDGAAFGDNTATINTTMPRLGGNNVTQGGLVDFSGMTWNAGHVTTVGMSVSGLTYTFYGSVTLKTGMNFSHNKSTAFQSRTNATLTSAGNSFGATVTVALAGGAGNNTLTLADAFAVNFYLVLTNGTLSTDSAVTCYRYSSSSGTHTVMGSGTWSIAFYGNGAWTMGGTVDCGTSTIAMIYTATADAVGFVGGANTYNNITIAPGTGVLTFSGAFTVANLTMSGVGAKTAKFTKATTYHVTGTSFLEGTNGAPITIQSTVDDPTVAGDMFTLHFAGTGYVSTDWLVVKGCITDLATNWYAGANTTHDHNGDDLAPPQPTWTWGTPTLVLAGALSAAGGGTGAGAVYAPLSGAATGAGGGSADGAPYAPLAGAVSGAGAGAAAGAVYAPLAGSDTAAGGGGGAGVVIAPLAGAGEATGGGTSAGAPYAPLAGAIAASGGGGSAGAAYAPLAGSITAIGGGCPDEQLLRDTVTLRTMRDPVTLDVTRENLTLDARRKVTSI